MLPTNQFFLSISHLPTALFREWQIFYSCTRRDLIISIVAGVIFMLIPFDYSLAKLDNFLLGIVYFALFIYQFDISNQIHGVEADKLDKPDRPIVSGLVSLEGASMRYNMLVVAYLTLGVLLNVFWWTLLWVVVTYFHNAQKGDANWFTKNVLCMGFGAFAQLGAAWCIIAPLTTTAYCWVIVVSVWLGITMPLQDFSDQAGDKASNRKTLPLLVGDSTARKIVIGIWAIAMLLVTTTLMFVSADSLLNISYILATIFIIGHLVIMTRLWIYRTPKQDKLTYNLQVILYCIILFSSFCIQ